MKHIYLLTIVLFFYFPFTSYCQQESFMILKSALEKDSRQTNSDDSEYVPKKQEEKQNEVPRENDIMDTPSVPAPRYGNVYISKEMRSIMRCPLYNTGKVTYSNAGKGKLYVNGSRISESDYFVMCSHVDRNLWEQYRKGTKQRRAGAWLIAFGTVTLSSWAVMYGIWGGEWNVVTLPLFLGGWAFMGPGIPLYCVGLSRRNRSVNSYNAKVAQQTGSMASLTFGTTSNGIGLALNF